VRLQPHRNQRVNADKRRGFGRYKNTLGRSKSRPITQVVGIAGE